MRRLSVTTNVTLDGVMQAPGMPDEDVRDGFDRGGWATPYNDATMAQKMGEGMAQTGAMLFAAGPTRASMTRGHIAPTATHSPR